MNENLTTRLTGCQGRTGQLHVICEAKMKCKECGYEIGDAIHVMRKNGDRVCLKCMPIVDPPDNKPLDRTQKAVPVS